MLYILEMLTFAMLLFAVMITTARTVHSMIQYYQVQSVMLIGVIFLTAIESSKGLIIGLFIVIPLFLARYITPLLALATVPENIPVVQRLLRVFDRSHGQMARQQAATAWLRNRGSRSNRKFVLMVDLGLVAAAFLFAFTLASPHPGQAAEGLIGSHLWGNTLTGVIALAVSFSLLLLGLSTMIAKEDLISQVLGLLVMEHGMFLAAIRIIPSPSVTVIFIVGLFVYTMITLTILVSLLPELHHASGSVDIDQQVQLKG